MNKIYIFKQSNQGILNLLESLKNKADLQNLKNIISFQNKNQISLQGVILAANQLLTQNVKFTEILPQMADQAMQMLINPIQIPLLTMPGTVTLKANQIYQILCLSFFNYLVEQNAQMPLPHHFGFLQNAKEANYIEKLKSHMNYFISAPLMDDFKTREIKIKRISFDKEHHLEYYQNNAKRNILDRAYWENSKVKLQPLQLNKGLIEDIQNSIIVDFANKYIGGGVLTHGCVQEEIMFTIKSECLIAVLLCSVLQANEVVIIENTVDFNTYKGYSQTFQSQRIQPINKNQKILVMDAVNFSRSRKEQYQLDMMLKEINKAFIGFCLEKTATEEDMNRNISTGRWGCGAFAGDDELKLLIQVLAFSHSNYRSDLDQYLARQLIFSIFSKTPLRFEMVQKIIDKYQTVGILAHQIFKYNGQGQSLFDYLLQQ